MRKEGKKFNKFSRALNLFSQFYFFRNQFLRYDVTSAATCVPKRALLDANLGISSKIRDVLGHIILDLPTDLNYLQTKPHAAPSKSKRTVEVTSRTGSRKYRFSIDDESRYADLISPILRCSSLLVRCPASVNYSLF